MTCNFYNNNSEKCRVTKNLVLCGSGNVTIKNPCSVVDPILIVSRETFNGANYFSIPEFKRQYFITNIVNISNNLVEITGHCDVLCSDVETLKQNYATINKSQNNQNFYINDGSIPGECRKNISIYNFPEGFSDDGEYILVVSGGV